MNDSPLESRLRGTTGTRFLLELFSNSAQFPIANILLELLLEGLQDYLRAPDLYTILFASVAQAYWLSRWQTTLHPRRFWGNLIGPAFYTLIESLIEGPRFFTSPQHIAYCGFAVAIGALQTLRPRLPGAFNALAVIVEDMIRASILFVMYAIFEAATTPEYGAPSVFLADRSHQFVALAIPLLGLSAALAGLTAQHYLELLRQTSAKLRTYSEWLLGRDLLGRIIADPAALTLTRRERAVLFMDIRGFTRWSESRSPEEVVTLLNRYYHTIESILTPNGSIKFKFSADETMAVFPNVELAATAARELRVQIAMLLAETGLGAGIGLHTGPLVEGLLGSAGVKFYDVIGDTVNTAKRIEGAAAGGEVLVSDAVQHTLGINFAPEATREIAAKGKDAPLRVFQLG